MPKNRSSSSGGLGNATIAVAERSSVTDAKGSINLRIEANTRQLIDDAAAILGKTRTEFMIETARRQAIDVLLDQRCSYLIPSVTMPLCTLDNPAPGNYGHCCVVCRHEVEAHRNACIGYRPVP
jgi:uncharacterized protein (DUF1778 family)